MKYTPHTVTILALEIFVEQHGFKTQNVLAAKNALRVLTEQESTIPLLNEGFDGFWPNGVGKDTDPEGVTMFADQEAAENRGDEE